MNNKPVVSITRNSHFSHIDYRRLIIGLSGKLGLNKSMKQMKIIFATQQSIKGSNIIGNHLHKKSSNQWEFIYVLNQNSKENIFEFRYKNYNDPVKKKKLKSGDSIIVPPGCALGLKALIKDSVIIEISNKVFSDNYVKVELF